jgi:hypothetical protein
MGFLYSLGCAKNAKNVQPKYASHDTLPDKTLRQPLLHPPGQRSRGSSRAANISETDTGIRKYVALLRHSTEGHQKAAL